MARIVELLFEESPEEIRKKISKNTSFKIKSCEPWTVNGKPGCKLIFIDPLNRAQRRREMKREKKKIQKHKEIN